MKPTGGGRSERTTTFQARVVVKFAQLVVLTAKGGSGAPENQKYRYARRANSLFIILNFGSVDDGVHLRGAFIRRLEFIKHG